MNCSHCHGEFGPLPPIAVFVDTALAAELCSTKCMFLWSRKVWLDKWMEDKADELPKV